MNTSRFVSPAQASASATSLDRDGGERIDRTQGILSVTRLPAVTVVGSAAIPSCSLQPEVCALLRVSVYLPSSGFRSGSISRGLMDHLTSSLGWVGLLGIALVAMWQQ